MAARWQARDDHAWHHTGESTGESARARTGSPPRAHPRAALCSCSMVACAQWCACKPRAGTRNIPVLRCSPHKGATFPRLLPKSSNGGKSCVHPRIRVASRCAQTCEVLAGCTTKPRRVTPKPRSRCFSQDQRECALLLLGYSVTGEVGARCAQISLRASILAGSVSACARS